MIKRAWRSCWGHRSIPSARNSRIWSPEHGWAVRAGVLSRVCAALSLAGAALLGVQGLRLLWGHLCTLHCASGALSWSLIHSPPLPRLVWAPAGAVPGVQLLLLPCRDRQKSHWAFASFHLDLSCGMAAAGFSALSLEIDPVSPSQQLLLWVETRTDF